MFEVLCDLNFGCGMVACFNYSPSFSYYKGCTLSRITLLHALVRYASCHRADYVTSQQHCNLKQYRPPSLSYGYRNVHHCCEERSPTFIGSTPTVQPFITTTQSATTPNKEPLCLLLQSFTRGNHTPSSKLRVSIASRSN